MVPSSSCRKLFIFGFQLRNPINCTAKSCFIGFTNSTYSRNELLIGWIHTDLQPISAVQHAQYGMSTHNMLLSHVLCVLAKTQNLGILAWIICAVRATACWKFTCKWFKRKSTGFTQRQWKCCQDNTALPDILMTDNGHEKRGVAAAEISYGKTCRSIQDNGNFHWWISFAGCSKGQK